MTLSIRLLEDSQMAEADALLGLAFESRVSRLDDLHLYRTIQPDGWYSAHEDGRMIGTVGAVNYGTLAHIGFMTVHPEFQRRGIGLTLMRFILGDLAKKGVPLITLDASAKGRPLYEKIGFQSCGETWVYECHPQPSPSQDAAGVKTILPADLDELAWVDRAIFGADRRKVFKAILAMFPGRGFLQRDATGRLTGYLFAMQNRIGPWVMLQPEGALELMRAAFTLPYQPPLTLVVPSENPGAASFLEQHGFRRARGGAHMFLGDAPPQADRQRVWAQTSLGAG